MMDKCEEYSNYINEYLKNNPRDITVKITPEVKYLLYQQYLIGYNDGLSKGIEGMKAIGKHLNEK